MDLSKYIRPCQKCGCDKGFVKTRYAGTYECELGLNVGAIKNEDNSNMYDGAEHSFMKKIYCKNCGAFVMNFDDYLESKKNAFIEF